MDKIAVLPLVRLSRTFQEFPLLDLRDPVSSSTHLFTSLWAIFATMILWRLTRGDWVRRLSVTIFGMSMVILYAASGVFHALKLPRPELRVYQQLDQSAIYILIAGTCTPIMTMLLKGAFRKWLLIGIWILAMAGVICLWLLPKAPHAVMVGLYLGMGWYGISGIWHYNRAVGWRGTLWIVMGALLYTLGAVCELTKWPVIWPGVIQSHEVLHLADMAATFCFFVFVVRFALNYRPQPATRKPAPATPAIATSV